ncbi:MAG: serine hydrolase, partial [Flavobacteriaceae bacterium]|nr:serine hydrolase [Flavobacteriaceae bacterium]
NFNVFYYSQARSMARFGLLILNEGLWEDVPLITDSTYFSDMVNSSQSMNPAYGYLWWLNGKNSFRLPGSTDVFPGELLPDAPDDLFAGLGFADQKLYVVPSLDLVVIRMGDAADSSEFGPSGFDNSLWEKLNTVIQ